jgi:hypothetical protein
LLELLAVIAIIAILLGCLLPVLHKSRITAMNTATRSTIQKLESNLEQYRLLSNLYPIRPGASNRLDLGGVGFYEMTCAGLGQKASGSEQNRELTEFLSRGRFLPVTREERDGQGNLSDRFGAPLIIRFLVTGSGAEGLEQAVYIWSYGYDGVNHVNARPSYQGQPAPRYDREEAGRIRSSPAARPPSDDLSSW